MPGRLEARQRATGRRAPWPVALVTRFATRADVGDRLHRLRLTSVLILQSGLAAGVAWSAAEHLYKGTAAVFAPLLALVTLASSLTQRLRRTLELLVGVVVGLAVGNLLVAAIGTGALQVGLIVVLALAVAVLLGGSPTLMVQAGATAAIVATISPPSTRFYLVRSVDAAIGGVVGIVVGLLFLPVDAVSVVRRAGNAVLTEFAGALDNVAEATRRRDPAAARAAWHRGRVAQARQRAFDQALELGREIAGSSPLRRRQRGRLRYYVDSMPHLGHAIGNARVLLRRQSVLLERGEPVPACLPDALDGLVHAVRTVADELGHGREPVAARGVLLTAARATVPALADARTLSVQVVLAQVRSTAVDLLQACGLQRDEADRQVRDAVRDEELRRAHARPP